MFDADNNIQLWNEENHDNKIDLELGSIYADTPARCFILGTKYHSGYYGCSRCTTHGSFKKNRTCFPELSASLRTDDTFTMQLQKEHHKYNSILITDLHIKAISQVPLDAMHLVYLGITKKIIFCLINGDLNVRLNSRKISQINDYLATARETQPSEFSRRIRKITDYNMFKATEFRVFLLYTGMVVLKDTIPSNIYDMFMLLVCGIRILTDAEEFKVNNSCAKDLLHDFLVDFKNIIGKYLVSYNIHNAEHLADETLLQNLPLDRFATWEFESSNAKLKLFSRKPNMFLQQAFNRTIEKYHTKNNQNVYDHTCLEPNDKNTFSIDNQKNVNTETIQKKFITVLYVSGFRIDSSDKNKWFCTSNDEIWEFHSAFEKKHNDNNISVIIRGRKIVNKSDFFAKPISSKFLNIYKGLITVEL